MKWSFLLAFLQLAIGLPLLISKPDRVGKQEAVPPVIPKIELRDADGGTVASVPRTTASQTTEVSVGPATEFLPGTVYIAVGDTVRWTWRSNNHTVTSGLGCVADNTYCSVSDTNCSTGPLSPNNTVYSHTFGKAGTFIYYCRLHCGQGMIGAVIVIGVTGVERAPNGHMLVTGRALSNTSVTVTSASELNGEYGNPQTVTASEAGVFQFEDTTATEATQRFYKVSYP